MKNLYIRIVQWALTCMLFIIDKTMRHLVLLSDKKSNNDTINDCNDTINDCLDFEARLKSVSTYMKPPTHTFSHLFSRVDDIKEDTNKGVTIQIPRVVFPVLNSEKVSE